MRFVSKSLIEIRLVTLSVKLFPELMDFNSLGNPMDRRYFPVLEERISHRILITRTYLVSEKSRYST